MREYFNLDKQIVHLAIDKIAYKLAEILKNSDHYVKIKNSQHYVG